MRITLCGSTRFKDLFYEWNEKLALVGHTVYNLSMFGKEASDIGKKDNKLITENEKMILDLVHFDKILNSDAILVLNKEGYIGFSTNREILWARLQHKKEFYIETLVPVKHVSNLII